MSIGSVSEVADAIRQYQLLEPAQWDHLDSLQSKASQPRELVKSLLERDLVTPFQANQLMQGRGQNLLLGSYIILDRLGTGGTGQVFKAKHQKMRRIVALKVIRKELLTDAEVVARFYREIQVVSQVSHPNVVHAYDAGPIGETHFLAMEYVKGVDLARLVKESGPLPVDLACDYCCQAARGLQHIHEHGLIYRDIKPSNLLVTFAPGSEPGGATSDRRSGFDLSIRGLVKILDLGLARFQKPIHGELTGTFTPVGGVMMGTPDYMAPEQALDFHRADSRSDVYSLGCTLYFLLLGRPPFPGGTLAQKLLWHQQVTPQPVQAGRPEVPGTVVAILERMLAKEPADRFQTIGEVAELLGRCFGASPAGAEPATAITTAPVAISTPEAIISHSGILATGPPLPPVAEMLPAAGGEPLPTAIPLLADLDSHILSASAGRLLVSIPLAEPSQQPTSSDITAGQMYPAPAAIEVPAPAEPSFIARLRLPPRRWPIVVAAALGLLLVAGLGLTLFLRSGGNPPATGGGTAVSMERPAIPASERFDWQPEQLVAVLGEHRLRHWGAVTGVQFSPDGKDLVSYGTDQFIRIWDPATGRPRAAYPAMKSWVNPVVISADGKSAVTSSLDHTVRMWDIPSSKERVSFKGHQAQVFGVGLTADGRTVLSTGRDGTIRMWDGINGQERALIKPDNPFMVGPLGMAFDGTLLAFPGPNSTIRVWDVPANKERNPLTLAKRVATAMTFSRDRRLLAVVCSDRTIRLFDVERGEEIAGLQGHTQVISTVTFSADSRTLASASSDGTIKLWQAVGNGKEISSFHGHLSPVTSLAFSTESSTLVSASVDGTIRLWDPVAGKERLPLHGHQAIVRHIAFSPDGKTIATCSGDRVIHLWDAATGHERLTLVSNDFPASEGVISGVQFIPSENQTVAAAYRDGTVRFWDAGSGKEKRRALAVLEAKNLLGLACSRSGKMLAVVLPDSSIKLLELPSGRELHSLKGHRGRVHSLSFSADGKTLISAAADGSIRLWDTATGSAQAAFPAIGVAVAAIAADGKTLAWGGEDRSLHLLSVNDQKEVKVLPGHVGRIMGIAAAPGTNTFVSVGFDGRVVVWDADAKENVEEWQLPGPVVSAVFAPDSRHVATANSNGTVYLCRLTGRR